MKQYMYIWVQPMPIKNKESIVYFRIHYMKMSYKYLLKHDTQFKVYQRLIN